MTTTVLQATAPPHTVTLPNLRTFSARLRPIVVEALSCLPAPVQEFAVRRCVFVGFGKAVRGQVLRGADLLLGPDDWLVTLSEDMWLGDAHRTAVHEVAHAWLNTPSETLACEQVLRWGFWGFSADAEAAIEAVREREARAQQDTAAPTSRGPRINGRACGYCGQPVQLFRPLEPVGRPHVGRCRACEWVAPVDVGLT